MTDELEVIWIIKNILHPSVFQKAECYSNTVLIERVAFSASRFSLVNSYIQKLAVWRTLVKRNVLFTPQICLEDNLILYSQRFAL